MYKEPINYDETTKHYKSFSKFKTYNYMFGSKKSNKILELEEIVNITNDEVSTSDKIISIIDNIGSASEMTSSNSESVASATEEQTATVETSASIAEEVSVLATSLEEIVSK